LFGKQIQQSILGGIISELKNHSRTSIVNRYFPSTKLCPKCGNLNKLSLSDRIYNCDCGYSKDRDIHSANNILIESIPMERRNFKPVEFNISAIEKLKKSLSNSFVSIDYEAGRYNSLGLC
jgi:transposase